MNEEVLNKIDQEDFTGFVLSQDKFKCEKEEIPNLIKAMDMYFDREEVTKDKYYDLLPKAIREDIRFNISESVNKTSLFNDVLVDVLSDIEEAYGLYNVSQLEEIIQEIQNTNDDFEKNLSDLAIEYSITTIPDLINSFKNKLESLNEEDKNKIQISIDSLERIIKPDHFKELIPTMKFKNFDLSDPKRKYDMILSKYRNSGINIYKLSDMEKILSITFKDKVDEKAPRKLLITFCEYCKDMDNKVPADHLYMYYFCKDIINMHLINQKKLQKSNFDANIIYIQLYNKYKDLLLLF